MGNHNDFVQELFKTPISIPYLFKFFSNVVIKSKYVFCHIKGLDFKFIFCCLEIYYPVSKKFALYFYLYF